MSSALLVFGISLLIAVMLAVVVIIVVGVLIWRRRATHPDRAELRRVLRAGDVAPTGVRFGKYMEDLARWERYAPEAYEAIRNVDDVAAILNAG